MFTDDKEVFLPDTDLRVNRLSVPMKGTRNQFSEDKKLEVVAAFAALGTLRLTAAASGVSIATVRAWSTQPWWKETLREIRNGRLIQQNSKLSTIIDKGLALIEDRLENGEYVYNQKTGDVIRKPVSLRDTTTATNLLLTRQGVIDKIQEETVVTDTTVSIKDQLTMLANEFSKFNNRHKKEATDIAFLEETPSAIHEEREERLQNRGSEVYLETLSDSETGGTE